MATLTWAAPAFDGGQAVTGYKVQLQADTGERTESAVLAPEVLTYDLPEDFVGLVWVTAQNGAGWSQASAEITVTAPPPPGP